MPSLQQRLTWLFWLCALLSMPSSAVTIKHLEPANWWAGMQSPHLQLLVHADNIGQAQVELEYPGLQVSAVQQVENPNYLFIDLLLAPSIQAGTADIIFKIGQKEVARYPYPILARQAGSAQRQGFGVKDVIYLITPDRFVNGDLSNDQVAGMLEGVNRADPSGRHGGDIAGMLQALPYLQQLGISQIWPQSLTTNDSSSYSYHGYANTDLYQIDPRFGGNQQYIEFVQAAAKRNIGVIQDIVLNHIGSNHWWLADLPTSDWLNYHNKFAPTNHARSTVQDPYSAKVDKRAFVDGWFTEQMPDLNQRQPLLATYLIQNSIWWIETAGLSGIREDTYSYADQQFLANWSKRIMQEYPNFNIVGEEWSANPVTVAYWLRGRTNHDGYQSATPSMMDFPLYYALLSALTNEENWDSGWITLYQALANDVLYPAPHNLVLFEGNHDTPRIFSLLRQDFDLYRMAMVYLLTAPRIPQLYYGTEILAQSPMQRDDGKVRSDFPGGWPQDPVNAFNGKGLTAQQLQSQRLVQTLIQYRRQQPALSIGKMTHFSPSQGVYSYVRYHEQQQIWVFLNKNAAAQSIDLARYRELLPIDQSFKDLLTGRIYSTAAELPIEGRASLVLELLVKDKTKTITTGKTNSGE